MTSNGFLLTSNYACRRDRATCPAKTVAQLRYTRSNVPITGLTDKLTRMGQIEGLFNRLPVTGGKLFRNTMRPWHRRIFRSWSGICLCLPQLSSLHSVTFAPPFHIPWVEVGATSYFFTYPPRGAWPERNLVLFSPTALRFKISVFPLLHPTHSDCFEP